MAAHGIMIPSKVMAKNIDSLVRSAKASVDLDNGNLVLLNAGVSATADEKEVFTAATPNSATPTDLWMVGEPEVVMTDAKYKGLDPDPRNFYTPAGTLFTAFKVKKFDVVRLTLPNFTGDRTTETYANVASGSVKLAWASASTTATMFKLLEVVNIPIAGGAPGSNRVTAYRLEAIAE